MDMIRGSSDLVNYADTIIQLTRKGNKVMIKQTKQRTGKELEPFIVSFETDEIKEAKFVYQGVQETQSTKIAKVITQWIIENRVKSFKSTEGFSYCNSLGFKKNNYYEAVKILEEQGIISKGEGKFDPYIVSEEIIGGSNETN